MYGQYYVVRSTGPCTVTQTTKEGVTLTMVAVTDPAGTNGGEVGFHSVATSRTVTADDGVTVCVVPTFSRGAATQGGSSSPSTPAAPTPVPLANNAVATWEISPDMPYIALYYQVADASGTIVLNSAFGGADTPEELAEELNKERGMSSLLVFSSEGNKLIATAAAAGAAGNGMKFAFMSTQPPYPECLMTLAGGSMMSAPVKHAGVYTATVAGALNLSALTVENYAEAWLWLDFVSGNVSFPSSWKWVDGNAPSMSIQGRYFIKVLSDGVNVIAKLVYPTNTGSLPQSRG